VLQKEMYTLSKRRRNIWDDEDPIDFTATPPSQPNLVADGLEPDTGIEPVHVEFLDEAHEALSKLFNKTNKRARQMKGVRRRDAWQ
jgi:hypothetical protein